MLKTSKEPLNKPKNYLKTQETLKINEKFRKSIKLKNVALSSASTQLIHFSINCISKPRFSQP